MNCSQENLNIIIVGDVTVHGKVADDGNILHIQVEDCDWNQYVNSSKAQFGASTQCGLICA